MLAIFRGLVAKRLGPSFASWGVLAILTAINNGLLPWLFWTRINQGRPSLQMFIFAAFDFYDGRYVKFLQVASIIACIGSIIWLCVGGFLIFYDMKLGEDDDVDTGCEVDSFEYEIGVRVFMVAFALFCGGFFIASVEKLITLNHVDLSEGEFLSSGQLIPFVVGVFTFVSTIWSVLMRYGD